MIAGQQQSIPAAPGLSRPSQDSGAEQQTLAEMSEIDKFGLAGLLRMIHSDSADVASLAVGQDLMTLGLDLNQPEYVFTQARKYSVELTPSSGHCTRLSLLHLLHLYRVCRWNRILLSRVVIVWQTFNPCNQESRVSVMRPYSTSSTVCLEMPCKRSRRKNSWAANGGITRLSDAG